MCCPQISPCLQLRALASYCLVGLHTVVLSCLQVHPRPVLSLLELQVPAAIPAGISAMLANEHLLNSLQLRHLQSQLSEQVSAPALLPWEVCLAVLLACPRRWPHACMRRVAECRAACCLHMQGRLPALGCLLQI